MSNRYFRELGGLIMIAVMVGMLVSVKIADAHVVVKPNEVGIGSFQTFTIGVPGEKNSATKSIRLVVPEGLQYVTPNVKQGWTISIKKSGENENAVVTEIIWTGGSIPVGQRDDFLFSAKVPSTPTALNWKAYQTYADGSVVAWDVDPTVTLSDVATSGPYSITNVIDDLNGNKKASQNKTNSSLTISIVALVISLVSLRISKKGR